MILRAVIFGLGFLFALSARAATPTIDGAVGATVFENDAGNVTSVSGALTTAGSPDIIVCAVAISGVQGAPATLTNCAGSGLTFALRKRYPNDMGTNCATLDVNPCNENIEIWEAVASGTLSAVTITANFASQLCHRTSGNNGCRASFVAFGVNGVHSTATPHDPSVSFPNSNFSATSTSIVSATYTTANAHDLLLYYFGSAAVGTGACGGANPLPITFASVGLQAIGSNCLAIGSLSVSSLVNTTYSADPAFLAAAWGLVGDAFTGDGLPPPGPNPPRRPFLHGWPW